MAAAQNDFQGRFNEFLSSHQQVASGIQQLFADFTAAGRNGALEVMANATARIEAATKAHADAMAALKDQHAKELEAARSQATAAQAAANQAKKEDAGHAAKVESLTKELAAIQGSSAWKAARAAALKEQIAEADAQQKAAEAAKAELVQLETEAK